ncbi:MAG: 3-dehydroquinate dehydratase [Saprospiraceae bacterium]|nr:3-dehydroquinate dehydratase [Saprospiraceae bacterium]
MWTIPIINGPNLNLTGIREIEIYGSESFEEYFLLLKNDLPNVKFSYHQSNHEGALVDIIQSFRLTADALIINPGAYTHTSVALRDALSSVDFPIAEVHISSVRNRETFRQTSMIQDVCYFQLSGYGLESYRMACLRLLEYLNATASSPVS